ncbi:MAG: mannose-1-phosphate guanylyltransferase/mannose-6-phosphate isomerase [Nanobdellota archaeon]
MHTIILAGGSGTRLWPLSREYYPKQFLKFKKLEGKSLFQLTFSRALKLSSPEDIIIVTNENHKFLCAGQIEELGVEFPEENILVEKTGRNTLPAITYAMRYVKESAVIFPADHLIKEDITPKIKEAKDKHLLTFGIYPTHPHTGYGYIKHSEGKVEEFKEKPDSKTAEEYITLGYLWNSGFFLFDREIFEKELKKHSGILYRFLQGEDIPYEELPDISVDYGLLEKTDKLWVKPMQIEWTDLGSFDSIHEAFEKDKNDNVSNTSFLSEDSQNNLISSDTQKLVAAIGVKDLIVIDTRDALMICNRNESQKVKNLVKKAPKELREFHQTVYRPWGSFTILEENGNYKVKRLKILPGKILSLQKHKHRSENWVVVSGNAYIVKDYNEYTLSPAESIYIPAGSVHRIGNKAKEPLIIIETQTGDYLGEDDIERLEDQYGRN